MVIGSRMNLKIVLLGIQSGQSSDVSLFQFIDFNCLLDTCGDCGYQHVGVGLAIPEELIKRGCFEEDCNSRNHLLNEACYVTPPRTYEQLAALFREMYRRFRIPTAA